LAFIGTMKDDMRTSANAQETAQAQVTDTTATENKQVAMDTAKRNMPTIGHIVETFVRPLLMRFVELDEQFLPEQIVIEEQRMDGRYVQKTIEKASLPPSPSVYVNPATDMDHSPAMLRRLGSFLDAMVQWSSVFGEDLKAAGFDPMMWIKLGAKGFHMNPNDAFNAEKGRKYVEQQQFAQQQEARRMAIEEKRNQQMMEAAAEEQRAFGKPGLGQPKLKGSPDESASQKRRGRESRKGS